MGAFVNTLSIVLLLCLIGKGMSQCELKNLIVSQEKTEATVKGKPEFNVTVTNDCACAQGEITLDCKGFQTVEKIDPDILAKSGDVCNFNYQNYMGPRTSISFKYAWDSQFPLTPISSMIACS